MEKRMGWNLGRQLVLVREGHRPRSTRYRTHFSLKQEKEVKLQHKPDSQPSTRQEWGQKDL